MNFLRTYYSRIIKQDLVNKFKLKENRDMPRLVRVTLNFGCKNFSVQKFATTMLALEMISLKKSTITSAKKPNVLLKVQKGQPSGCKVVLRNKELYGFITKLNLAILPKLKNFFGFNIKSTDSNFFFQMHSKDLMLEEFERSYPLFANLPALDVNIETSTRNPEKVRFLAKSIKAPFLQKNGVG